MFNFSPDTKHESPNSLIPNGTLAFAMVSVRGLKNSTTTGGEYADLELVLLGQFEGRRVWPMIANPTDERNSEKWRQMAMASIQHACEACGLFNPANPQSYARFANASFIDILTALDGQKVAIKVGIEKGTDGHQDKNKVAVWLTPNPVSSDSKLWAQLLGGETASNQPQQGGFVLGGSQQTQQTQPTMQPGQPMQPAAVVSGGTEPAWLRN
jgi:hypothetical protein